MVASPEAAGVKSVGETCTHRHVHVYTDSLIEVRVKGKIKAFHLDWPRLDWAVLPCTYFCRPLKVLSLSECP